MTARIQVKETQKYCEYSLEGTLESIIAALQAELDAGWEGIESKYVGYDGVVEYYIYKHREENDKEYEKRLKQLEKEKAAELKAKERRRKEYEKLKKEFGDD